MTTVYLVRHAEAQGNKDKVFQGRTDCNLTEKGYVQLDALSERFKEIKIDKLYSSPLKRTIETAKAVNKYHNLPVIIKNEIIEINGGGFEGQQWDKVSELFPEAYRLWANEHHNFKIDGGESMIDVYERMKKGIASIVKESPDKTVAVVSHGCAIRNYLCYANKIPFEKLSTLEWADNTAISKLEFGDDLVPKIIYQNDSSHLSDENATIRFETWWKE